MITRSYELTVGLEIHAELKTRSKMFCPCHNDGDEVQPNKNICPICTAHPGTLPVINKEAVLQVLRVGTALGGKPADFTEFDRKNYFYPDIPKGYQISQYAFPLIIGGSLNGVQLTRIHLEEDTARSQHDHTTGKSLVDYNRSGVPLLELVTEPVMHSAQEAGNFARELRLLLRYLGSSEANMEKGQMRVEANISISADPERKVLGTKVEVKNLNSFRTAERAIEFEFKRQVEALEKGEKIIQETRGWDEERGLTFSQRKKESSHDYRYFPEPDLPKLKISEIAEFENLSKTLPELPWEKRERYFKNFKLKAEDAELLVTDERFRTLFEVFVLPQLAGDQKLIQTAVNYITNDLVALVGEKEVEEKLARVAETFVELIKMIGAGEISSRGGKDLLRLMLDLSDGENLSPRALATKYDLLQKSDEGALGVIIEQVIADNQKVATDYLAGKEAALQFLVGQGMKASRGSANPEILKKLLVAKLNKK